MEPEVAVSEVRATVDVAALRAWLTAHAGPGLDHRTAHADGSTHHHRAVRTGRGPSCVDVHLPVDGAPVTLRATGGDAGGALATGRRWLGLDDESAGALHLGRLLRGL